MKFQCERCKTRYSIADDKVRGKILKIRCKSCAAIITVRDGAPARPAPEPGAAVAGASRPRPSTVEVSAGALAVASPVEAPVAAEEWYLAIDGAQEGPFSAEQAQVRVAAKSAGVEMFAWRDDFVEWLPVEQVPVLAVHLPRPRPGPPPPPRPSGARRAVTGPHAVRAASGMSPLPLAPPAATATPPVAADPDALFARDPLVRDDTDAGDRFAPAAGTGPGASAQPDAADELTPPPKPSAGFDFAIGEASRMVKLPILAPGPRPAERAASSGLPGVAPAPPNGEPAPATKPRADQSLQLAIASLSGSGLAPPVAAAVVRRRRLRVPLVAGGMAMTGVLAGVFLLSRGGDDGARASASETRTSVLVDNFYSKDNPLLAHEAPHAPAPASAAAADPTAKAGPKVASLAPRPHAPGSEPPVHLDPVTRPEPPRIGGPARSGKSDTFDGDALGPADPLTPDDVRNAYAANEVGLKRCYERSLKADPTSNVTKMVVKLTITPQGGISEISVPDRTTDLGSCVSNSIRSWRFRRSSGEFTTEFTVFFAKRS